jgi:hypothetical protein
VIKIVAVGLILLFVAIHRLVDMSIKSKPGEYFRLCVSLTIDPCFDRPRVDHLAPGSQREPILDRVFHLNSGIASSNRNRVPRQDVEKNRVYA